MSPDEECNHDELVILYHFGQRVDLMFQCTRCQKIVNKLDNRRTFTIVPNPKMDNPPITTGLWFHK